MSDMPEECEVTGCHQNPQSDLYEYEDGSKSFFVCGGCFASHTSGEDVENKVKTDGIDEVNARDYQQAATGTSSKKMAQGLKTLSDAEDSSVQAALSGMPTSPEGEPSMYEREIQKRFDIISRFRQEIKALKLLRKHNCDNHWGSNDFCRICGRDGRV